MGATGWSLLSALCGGLGVVLQQKGAMEAPPATSSGFVASILRKPVWLAGAGFQAGCWVTQGIALTKGPLALVEPLISLQIVMALPLGVWLTHQVVGRREWLGAAFVVIGVSVFVVVSNPGSGRSSAPRDVWLASTGVIVALTTVAALVGAHRRPALKAALYGTAAGILFGYQAAVMNAFVDVAPNGLHAILTSWSTYGLIASALAAFYLMQAALQVGVLAPAIATSNAACPITSVALGRSIFLETPQRTTGGKIVSLVSLALLLVGLVVLARGEAAQPPTAAAGTTAPAA